MRTLRNHLLIVGAFLVASDLRLIEGWFGLRWAGASGTILDQGSKRDEAGSVSGGAQAETTQ
eukprot:scaffold3296_cov405-Prasinococcus_capsulatus_cf.AAC.14